VTEQTANRFLDRSRPIRVAAIVTARFPENEQVFAYEMVRRQSDWLDAELRIAASETSDPLATDASTKAWLGHGLFCQASDLLQAADAAHFRATQPRRLDALLDELAHVLHKTRDEVLGVFEVRLGISITRWLQAWAPDVLYSFFGYAGSLWAHIAARLLGIPRVWITFEASPDDVGTLLLNSLHARNADFVVTRDAALTGALGGETRAGARWLDMEQSEWEAKLARRVAERLRRQEPSRTRADLGPRAAFAGAAEASMRGSKATPFLVAGAERTGSNLLVEMLSSHRRVQACGELFNTEQIEQGKLDCELPTGVDRDEILSLRLRSPAACHQRLHEAAAAHGVAACGFKLLYYHGLAENRIVEHLRALTDLRIVHLVREDAVARWISQMRAMRSGSWWSAEASGQKPRAEAIELQPAETLLGLEFNQQMVERFRATFRTTPILELSYEKLTADFESSVHRVQLFLGLPAERLTGLSQKTGERDPRRSVSNWPALVEAFADTRWRGLFQEIPPPDGR
jgi:LPS sulfotransferase NodH